MQITREQIKEEIESIYEYRRTEIKKLRQEREDDDSMATGTSTLAEAAGLKAATEAQIRFWESLIKYAEEQ